VASVAEMRWLDTRKDKIRNKYIWEKVELSPIEKIMFGHMRRTI